MPFEVTFTVLWRPSPRRQLYETCADDEPLEITVQYLLNLWRHDEDDESDTTKLEHLQYIAGLSPDRRPPWLPRSLPAGPQRFPLAGVGPHARDRRQGELQRLGNRLVRRDRAASGRQRLPLKQHIGSKFSFCRVPLSIQAHGFGNISPLPAPRQDRAGLATCVEWRRARKGGNLANPTVARLARFGT